MRRITRRYITKKNQKQTVELKDTLNEMKNVMENTNNRFNEAGERICEIEDRSFEITQ